MYLCQARYFYMKPMQIYMKRQIYMKPMRAHRWQTLTKRAI
ncbi:hypothetical protein A33M_0890 [Rhodovulum sp. PH10]|nr:hypothetical protein A33M_0890 [Rhodovulum sp. PH10]